MTTIETIQALPPGERFTTSELRECCGISEPTAWRTLREAQSIGLVERAGVDRGKHGRPANAWRRL